MNNGVLVGDSKNEITIKISESPSGIVLRPFQEEAISCMTKNIKGVDFSGILVLPTGAGKTLTSAYWIARNVLDKGGRVLWVAHRHELLDQACKTFTNLCHTDVFKEKKALKLQLLSGVHDKTIQVSSDRDVVIASVNSLCREQGFYNLKKRWLSKSLSPLLLVIDEAHHSTAKSYRNLISNIKGCLGSLRILGLTATPYRTSDCEKGLLKKIFKDDIIYSIDLKTLVAQGYLAEPIFESYNTDIDLNAELSDSDRDWLKKGYDIDSIGKTTAETIAKNATRNRYIAETYLSNRERFKKTIIFAINQDNAIAINSAIKQIAQEKKISDDYACDFVISASDRGVSGNSKENKEKINSFKNGSVEVLTNVAILTEGTDLPDTQTIFLTRPTHSKVLLTQMIGRGLRGGIKGASGTKNAYIVSFMDEWGSDFGWESPEKLYIDESVDFRNLSPSDKKRLVRLVSIKKIEEFARLCNTDAELIWVDETNFFQLIPMGFYFFKHDEMNCESDDFVEKTTEILVYENLMPSYRRLMNDLPVLLSHFHSDDISDYEVECCASMIDAEYFGDTKFPAYSPADIRSLIKSYVQTKTIPDFIPFEDRDIYDLDSFVEQNVFVVDSSSKRNEIIESEWNSNSDKWQALFGLKNAKVFRERIRKIIDRLENPEDYDQITDEPVVFCEERTYEDMDFNQLREQNFQYYCQLRKQVIDRNKRVKSGVTYYYSSISGYEDVNLSLFEIDHIKPFNEGGKTALENLRLVTRKENRNRHNDRETSQMGEIGNCSAILDEVAIDHLSEKSDFYRGSLIDTVDEIIQNVRTLKSYLKSLEYQEKDFAKHLIQRGVCFYPCEIDGELFFAPSRFVGYYKNGIDIHMCQYRNGGESNRRISNIVGRVPEYNKMMEKKYEEFCDKIGVSYLRPGQHKFWLL